MILFCVIRDLYPDINQEKGELNLFAVDIDTIKSSITLHGKANRLKLYTHSQHQSDFEDLILNGKYPRPEKSLIGSKYGQMKSLSLNLLIQLFS